MAIVTSVMICPTMETKVLIVAIVLRPIQILDIVDIVKHAYESYE